MRISTKLKQDLIKYNLNFPIDGRTNAFKESHADFFALRNNDLFVLLILQMKVSQQKSKLSIS